jgi:Mrp family chromosome partitioning ATPase
MIARLRDSPGARHHDGSIQTVSDAVPGEVFRQVYAQLELSPASGGIIGITSAISGEGRTTIALGMARTLANDLDIPVLLVEADFDRPSIAGRLGLSVKEGLCEVLRGEARLESVMLPIGDNLAVITAGTVGTDAGHLLGQLPILDPFHSTDRGPSVVLIDLPPITAYGYSARAARIADVTVLVVRSGVTPIETVREAVSRLGDQPPRGLILNAQRSALPAWWPAG